MNFFLRDLLPFDVRQASDAMPLQTAVQGRARQMRDRRLQGIEAVVERQERVPAESDDHRLLLDREHSRLGFLRAGSLVGDGGPLTPLGDRLLIDAVAASQCSQALLTMLYRSTDCLCRGGAPV